MFTRSTKGASKQRRELINVEINNIRDMLPLQEGIRKRLSQLQVMAICKAFIGKNNFFEKIASMPCSSSEENQLSFEFSQALPGFLLMASIDGKFLYLSDNVMEILGHSMVDFVTQSETIFDLFDERGQAQVMKLLSGGHGNREDFASGSTTGECSLDEISFTCLMGLSKNIRRHPGLDRQKVMKVRARLTRPANYLEGGEPVLVAFCCPWSPVMPTGDQVPAFSTTVCQTRHSMDMKFLDIDANGQFHLGYSANELQLQSWYRFIHPDHEAEFASKHLEVISNGPDCVSSIFIRVQTKYGHFIWLHVIMRMLPGSEFSTGQSEIACISHVLDEEEVTFRKEREQLEAEMGDYGGNAHMYKSQGNGMYQVPTAIVDDRFLGAPVGYMSQPDMWNENEVRGKRKSTGDDAYGRPRKMRSFTASEDSASSASSSSMMYSSPMGLDVDRSLQSDQMETCLSRDFFPADFNMKLEDPFQPKALSPYSMLSDSIGSSSSPRMYPEDDGSFFRSMSASPKQKNIHGEVSDLSLLNEGIGPINDLTNLKSLVPEAMMLASPNQEAPKELPELDLTDLNDYLKTVEDGKKPRVLANLGDLSYTEYLPPAYDWNHRVLQQKQTQHLPEKCASLTYEPQPMQGEEFCYDKPTASRNNSGFSSVAFLESLIESPQFTELIGMMANGPQKHLGFQEQGLSCFG